jgi:hypothetical protein
MADGVTEVAGLMIPSNDPLFLLIVAIHIPLGLMSVGAGLVAMLSVKSPGRHPRFGTIYFWLLTAVFVSATALSLMRWAHSYHLFILGSLAFMAALVGRSACRRRWPGWERLHIAGMGSSYVLLLIAFYVDNGKQLPLWKSLPTWTYWALPALVGLPIIIRAMLRHPLVLQARFRKLSAH